MKWRFSEGDIILCNSPDAAKSAGSMIFRIANIQVLDRLDRPDELRYQYCIHNICGRSFWMTKKFAELHYAKVNSKKFGEFFDLFYEEGLWLNQWKI